MNFVFAVTEYLSWHYSSAFRDAVLIWRNFFWFVVHFFSIPLLSKTLFHPWRRMEETYTRTGMNDFFAVMVTNVMSRFLGFLVRLILILIGVYVFISMFILMFVFFAVWLVAPAIPFVLIVIGLRILI
jgi:hypothetical protein